MQLDIALAAMGIACFGLALISALLAVFRPSPSGERRVCIFLLLGCLPLVVLLILRGLEAGHIPAFTRFEALSTYAIFLTLAYLAFMRTHDLRGLSAILVPYALAILLLGLPGLGTPSGGGPALQSVWLGMHILTAFSGYALFTLAAVMAAVYLVQDYNLKNKRFGVVFQRLPALATLDQFMYREIGVGFFLFSVSIILGTVNVRLIVGGAEWLMDPKIGATIATWGLYAVLLHIRAGAQRGRKVALMTLAGLVLVLFSFLGVSYLGGSVHDVARMGLSGGLR